MSNAEFAVYWTICEDYLQNLSSNLGMEFLEAVDFLAEVVSEHSREVDSNGFPEDYSPVADAMYEACVEVSGVFCPNGLSSPSEFMSELNPYE